MNPAVSAWSALVVSISVSIVGQALLKSGAGEGTFRAQLFDPRTVAGLAAYALAALFYIVALRRLPVSVALPFTAVSYLAAAAVGYFVFAERLNLMQGAALGVICAGVLMLALGST